MLLLPALHPEKWRWGAIRSERRSEGPACLLSGLMMAVARGRILSRPLVRCGRPAAHHATTRHRPRRSSRRPPTPPCRLSSSNVPKQRSRPRVAVALRQPYPRRRLPSTDARRRHLVRRTDGRVAPIRLVHRQSCVPVGAKQARNACRYRPGQLARRERPRAGHPPSEPRGADRRPPTRVLHVCRLQASVARRGSAWFSRSCWWSDHAIRRRALGNGGLVVLVRAKVGAKQARATVLCACGALGERCRARHVEVPHRASVPLLEKSLLFPVQPSPLPCHRVPAKNSYRQICRPVGLSGLQGV